jgi:N-acetylglucosamine-6-sulfatase
MNGGTQIKTNSTYVPPAKITLEAWVYPTAYVAGQGRIIAIETNCTNPCVHLRLVPSGLKFLANWTTGSITGAVPATAVPLNQWSHVAVTYDGSSVANLPAIYVNGTAQTVTISSNASGSYGNNPAAWAVGNDGGNGLSAFQGVIDEARVYDYIRTPAQINLDMTLNPGTICTTNCPDTTPPTVSLTYPVSGQTISNNITLTANTADNVAVAGVQFKIDGINSGAQVNSAPYALSLDTTTLSDGSHTITAQARDTSNNTAVSAPVTVTVNNRNRPNIALIVDDDQRWDTMNYMPIITSIMSPESVKFDNFFVSTPLCCPSRSSILTGLFSHNTGVLQNFSPNGGATVFNDSQTIAVWLKNSGYRTALIGKYLNDYSKLSPYIPPGWDNFQAFLYEDTIYYNYVINNNGVIESYGSSPTDYSTDVIASKAAQFIFNAPANQPLFLYFTPAGPHSPAKPADIDIGKYAGIAPWRPPSFNETDVSDKPTWIQSLPLLTSTDIASIDSFREGQLETLQSVDRAVKSVWDALASTGRLNNTIVIFLSDNGLSWGEHRLVNSKECPYEECIRVPMWIRTPGGQSRDDPHLVENIDLAPTITDFAGVIPTSSKINGVSFRPLLTNPNAPWRSEIFLEELGTASTTTTFQAVRNSQYIYIEYANGDRELYDLLADPYQLQNVYADPNYASVLPVMQALLTNLKNS